MGEVSLAGIDESNWRATLQVSVRAEQLRFVADHQPVALVVLAKSYVRPGGRRWTPLAILADGLGVVGVAALADRDGVCELFHLAVDHRHQRRGLGRQALGLLLDHAVQVLGCRRVELTVHPENRPAQRLYAAAGFRPTGGRRHGEPVWSRAAHPDR